MQRTASQDAATDLRDVPSMRTGANRCETSTMKMVSYSSSSTRCCSACSLFSAAGLTASYATRHRANTRATLSCTPRVMLHDAYIMLVPRPCFLASATLPPTGLMSQTAASFFSSAVPPPCSRMIFSSVEHFAARVHCTDASLHIIRLVFSTWRTSSAGQPAFDAVGY